MSDVQSFDVVVVGGGVAGLTAGLFSARLGRSTMVLVSLIPGGHLANINQIEDFPGFPQGVPGYDLGPIIQEQAMNAGAEFAMAELQSIARDGDVWKITTPEGEIHARAVIVATGSENRPLGVPGEEEFTGRGVSHCASCDGPLLKGKKVIVAGAGDSGLQEALTLCATAADVLILHRDAQPKGQAAYLRRVEEQGNIKLQGNTEIEAIVGDNVVTAVRLRDTGSGASSEIAADAVFVYIGLKANTAFLQGVAELDDAGCIKTDIQLRASAPGLFAAGDVRADSSCQAIAAAGDGATAAVSADRYLNSVFP
jgi:thioredoxin reductase (NADPH)